MVGTTGFEPATSCAQGRRATRLRYVPNQNRSIRQREKLDNNQFNKTSYTIASEPLETWHGLYNLRIGGPTSWMHLWWLV